jgi:hypothetical protein
MGPPGSPNPALAKASARFAEQVRIAQAPRRRMPNSDWSPVEAAVHVLQLIRIFNRLRQGGTSPYTRHEEFPRISDELIAAEPERDPAALALAVEGEVRAWLLGAEQRSPTDPFDWHGIVTITLADAGGILLGEFLLHGRDIACAGGGSWTIAPDEARTVLRSILPLLPFAVDRERAAGVRATYGLRVRGMERLTFRFDDGTLAIAGNGGPADCSLAGDPVAVLLVAYGRWSQWQAIARGRLYAWGRRPALAFRFTSLLRNP